MRIHYAGKFDGDVSKLPHRKHEKNAVGFKEAETVEGVEKAGLKVVPAILVIETIPLILLRINPFSLHISSFFAGLTLAILTLPVHEVLHAVCFRGDVYIFSNLKRGMAFTVGTESMSKRHFFIYVFISRYPARSDPLRHISYKQPRGNGGNNGVPRFRHGSGRLYKRMALYFTDAERFVDVHERHQFLLVYKMI